MLHSVALHSFALRLHTKSNQTILLSNNVNLLQLAALFCTNTVYCVSGHPEDRSLFCCSSWGFQKTESALNVVNQCSDKFRLHHLKTTQWVSKSFLIWIIQFGSKWWVIPTLQLSGGAGYSFPVGLSAASGLCLASLSQMWWDQTTEQLDGRHITACPCLSRLFSTQSAMWDVRSPPVISQDVSSVSQAIRRGGQCPIFSSRQLDTTWWSSSHDDANAFLYVRCILHVPWPCLPPPPQTGLAVMGLIELDTIEGQRHIFYDRTLHPPPFPFNICKIWSENVFA